MLAAQPIDETTVQQNLAEQSSLGTAASLLEAGVSIQALEAFAGEAAIQSPPVNIRCTLRDISGSEADDMTEVLLALGAQSATIEEHQLPEEGEQEIFAANDERSLWHHCSVVALFEPRHEVHRTLRDAQRILGAQGWQYEVEPVVDEEWEAAIKASYKPVRVDDGIWIVPDWCELEDPEAINIRLVPGLAFGTGEHATTRLCLKWLKDCNLSKRTVCDYGCGSGVLAIAALLMGAGKAVGLDIDPFALKASEDNAALNGVQESMTVLPTTAKLVGKDPLECLNTASAFATFDVLVANILKGPLTELAPRLASYVHPGGRLAMSGILEHQVPELQEVFDPYFCEWEIYTESRWALLTGRRKALEPL